MIESHGKLLKPPADLWDRGFCIHFEYEHNQSYLSAGGSISLHVIAFNNGGEHQALVTAASIGPLIKKHQHADDAFELLAAELSQTPIAINQPLQLEPVFIPKPWGQEVWYTGIEDRGTSTVANVPIAWLLDVFSKELGSNGAPLLLKILDPHPAPNLGDLYFEMHEQKVEVYVVTHIDDDAWPNGSGKIRYGFNQSRIKEYESTADFLNDYVKQVSAYREVRQTSDDRIGALKREEGIEPGMPVSPQHYERLIARIPTALTQQELSLRDEMYEFTATRDLGIGDVVTVAPFVPHSLQHGVRVIEFQTPHYERFILSFGQEVLTQDHWDTEAAIGLARTEEASIPEVKNLMPGQDLVADFDEFKVIRIRLDSGQSTQVDLKSYVIAMGVDGEMNLRRHGHDLLIGPESGFYLSANDTTMVLENSRETQACILLAFEPTP